MDDPASLIQRYFQSCINDSEFSLLERIYSYTVIGPPSDHSRIIYTTKSQAVVRALGECGDWHNLGMIGRYGLPNDHDAAWIRAVVGPRELLFLGDMDPPDLMIFAWLRERLHPIRVTHLGINDTYLDQLQVVVPKNFMIKLGPSEKKSLPILRRVLPDMANILGPRCAAILNKNLKIELEAVKSAQGEAKSIIPPLRS
jgi:hypothetical protein